MIDETYLTLNDFLALQMSAHLAAATLADASGQLKSAAILNQLARQHQLAATSNQVAAARAADSPAQPSEQLVRNKLIALDVQRKWPAGRR